MLKENGVQQSVTTTSVSENVTPLIAEVETELTNEHALQGVKQFAELKLQSGNRQLYAT